jgi:hypothetical protein
MISQKHLAEPHRANWLKKLKRFGLVCGNTLLVLGFSIFYILRNPMEQHDSFRPHPKLSIAYDILNK